MWPQEQIEENTIKIIWIIITPTLMSEMKTIIVAVHLILLFQFSPQTMTQGGIYPL